ncbi:MAG: mandelate racemase/muconate lactonizing enzyme family protein [Pseudomonadota bacterium]
MAGSDLKIKDIKTTRYQSKEAAAARTSYGTEILVVDVESDDGTTGLGFASASAETGPILSRMISNIIKPLIVSEDPRSTDLLWRRMFEDAIPRRGGDGLMRNAIAAVDFALWDIKGKAAGVPVWKLFGGGQDLVPTYANCAHHMPPDRLAETAASYVAAGHRALKIRGTRTFVSLAEATERVRQVREAIGPDIRLMVDVNGSWDVDTAIQQLKAWEPYDVYWLEEPVPPQNVPGYARIRERAGATYIVGGEQHAGLLEFQTLIDSGGVDIVQPNASLTGGITDWLRIHSYATAHGVPVSPWNLQQVHIHMAAGLPNVQWIEYFMADNALLKFQGELFEGATLEQVVTDTGVMLRAPTTPGLGLAVAPAVAEATMVRD